VPDIETILRERFKAAMSLALGPEHASTDPQLRAPNTAQFGDFQANAAMSLGKALGSKPRDVAEKIVAALDVAGVCSKVEIAGPGFINLHLTPEFIDEHVSAQAHDSRLGVALAQPAQSVVVDYGGPNVAKEMHVGHLRSTIIGDAIVRVLAFEGHNVIRQNHIGDWGTQFGMLIESMVESDWQPVPGQLIGDLNTLYQAAKKRFDDDADFAARARQRVVLLQGGDERTLGLWRKLVAQSQEHFQEVYSRLGVLLESSDVRGESFYNPRLPGVVQGLDDAGLLKISQGAAVVCPEGFKNEEGEPLPLIVRKSDGGYLYATTDLAAARFRLTDLGAQRLIYVADSRQAQHFAMVFATLRLAGWAGGQQRLDYVPFGTVLGKDRKPFKTRSGEVLKLIDLLNEAQERAASVLAEKEAGRPSDLTADARTRVAKVVGIGALKYADLSSDRIKDYIFDWDRMLAMEGNTAPYLQNAYVRIRSIFRKAQAQGLWSTQDTAGTVTLREPAERALGLKLLLFSGVVRSVAQSLEPHRLCNYLYELAALYHQFYENCPVLTAPDDATRKSRLTLCGATADVLKKGLELLGIEVVEQM
jgi:arginyl-tRNA synthetase